MKKQLPFLMIMMFYSFQLSAQDTLKTVKVESTRKSILKSLTITSNFSLMTSKELLKAACCNLAESFETNPSIDVNFSDALTGFKLNHKHATVYIMKNIKLLLYSFSKF